jgi:6-phosphofructokinase 1
MKTIGVLTSGGDGPGMNAAIRGVVRTAVSHGMEVVGIRRGYEGMIEGDAQLLPTTWVSGIIRDGGTNLLTARSEEFKTRAGQCKAVEVLKKHGIEGLVVIGGDGSFRGAHALDQKWGIPAMGVPATIDNDIAGTDVSIGFNTAVNTALNAIDHIRDTAVSHDRIFVVEVMGRDAGFLALEVGLAGGAEHILIPEIPFKLTKVGMAIKQGIERGKISSIIVVAEGAAKGIAVAAEIEAITGAETRATVLGHVQRGGSPTALDRILGVRLGAAAVDLLVRGEHGLMVGMIANEVVSSPLETAWRKKKSVNEALYALAETLAK